MSTPPSGSQPFLDSWRSLSWSLKRDTPPRSGDLCGHPDDLQQAFLHHPLPRHCPPILSPLDARCQLTDEVATLYPEAPKALHPQSGKFVLRSSKDTYPGRV